MFEKTTNWIEFGISTILILVLYLNELMPHVQTMLWKATKYIRIDKDII